MRWSRKPLCVLLAYREFESLPLRQYFIDRNVGLRERPRDGPFGPPGAFSVCFRPFPSLYGLGTGQGSSGENWRRISRAHRERSSRVTPRQPQVKGACLVDVDACSDRREREHDAHIERLPSLERREYLCARPDVNLVEAG